MRRGRWVVYCFAIFSSLFAAQFSYAAPLAMTATVPLSPQWNESLRVNSEAKIDTSHPHILLVTQHSLGIEKLPVDRQVIQLLVFKNGKVVDNQEKVTNKKGIADFVYVAQQEGQYNVIVVNKTDFSPFVVKSGLLSL